MDQSALLIILLILISLFFITIIIVNTLNCIIKYSFLKQYHLTSLPKSIKIKKLFHKQKCNYYKLRYPCWVHSKKDGTADKRVKSNHIIWKKCELCLDNYLLYTKKPYDLIHAVKNLRKKGNTIPLCKEEKKKRSILLNKKKNLIQNNNIQKLVDHFSKNPTGFEKLCSEIFINLGYQATLTPPTNDGGYDILLQKKGVTTIVECKCYSIEHKIGRPSVQKLVGANSIVSADKMIFITTSNFSESAITYAQKANVELYNGAKLMNLLNKQLSSAEEKTRINISECQLEITDLHPYVPEDIYLKFFIPHK